MIDEAKPHTRNLKLISISFILYWILELEPVTETLQLPLLNYKVTNPEPLPWLAWLSLAYFFWRFWLTVSNYISQKYKTNLSIYANRSLSGETGLLARYLSYSVQKHFKNELYDEFIKELIAEERRSCVFRSIRTAIPASFGQAFRCRPDKLILTSHDFLFT